MNLSVFIPAPSTAASNIMRKGAALVADEFSRLHLNWLHVHYEDDQEHMDLTGFQHRVITAADRIKGGTPTAKMRLLNRKHLIKVGELKQTNEIYINPAVNYRLIEWCN